MGDCQKCGLRVDFDRTVRLTFVESKVTGDAALLAYRGLDEALGLTATAGKRLEDSRTGRNTRHALLPLIRQSIYSRLAGYEDVNDAERLCVDPAMRHIVGGRASQPEKMAASSSELGRFETEMRAVRPLPDPEVLSWRCRLRRTCSLRQARTARVSIRDPAQVESCVGAADSPPVGPASGTTLTSPQGFLRGRSLSCPVMGSETSCGRQGRLAQ